MTIASAEKFIDQAQTDDDLRKKLNKSGTYEKMKEELEASGYSFSSFEFETAFTNKLLDCQLEENANQLKELKMWWELLRGFLGGPTETASSCGSCSIKSSCSSGSCSSQGE